MRRCNMSRGSWPLVRRALWQAVPASYRTDLNALTQLAGNKIDAELYDQVFGMVGRLESLIDAKQSFILNTELGEALPAEQKAQLEAALPTVVSLIETVTSSSLATSAGLQAFDGQQFFDSTVSSLLSDIEAIAGLQERQLRFRWRTSASWRYRVDVTDTTATLKAMLPGQEAVEKGYAKVEGRWVPATLAEEWSQTIGEATAQLEAITPEQLEAGKAQAQMAFAMIDGVLSQIEAAETQQQFDQSLQGAMMPLMGLMMMGQQMSPPSAPPALPATLPATLPGQ